MKHFTIKEVKPGIFHFGFKDRYQLAMHFLRYQEFYESPNPKFRNHGFTLVDFMEWYTKAFCNGSFEYPNHWAGFNVPSNVFRQAIITAPEKNKYDKAMTKGYAYCLTKNSGNKFYIIGSVDEKNGDLPTMKHEIAHGFFYLNPEYKKEMTKLVKQLKPALYKKFCTVLKSIGYTPQVYIDECQAYFSTGIPKNFGIKLRGEDKPFVELYNRYYNVKSK